MTSNHSQFVSVGFKDLNVGRDHCWHLDHPWFSFCAHQSQREYMEDRMHVLVDPESSFAVFSIYDGHGGEYVSDYLEKHYSPNIRHSVLKVTTPNSKSEDYVHAVKKAISNVCLEIDQQIAEKNPKKTADAGSTLISAIIQNNKFLTVANIGDSRAIACDSHGHCQILTHDHKPSNVKEKQRVEDAGGVILKQPNDVPRVLGILAMTRSIGDVSLKPNDVITADPEVHCYDLGENRLRYIILASDGLFDVIGNEEIINLSNQFLEKNGIESFGKIADLLCKEGLRRGTMDNISVLVIKLVL